MSQTRARQRTTLNSRRAGTDLGISAVRRSVLSPPRLTSTFGTSSRPSNIFRQVGSGAPSISANLMSTRNTEDSGTPDGPRDQSRVATPLDYIDPDGNPFDPDQPPDPDNDQGNDHGDPPPPGGDPDPDDPGDDPDNNPPADNRPDGDRFIEAIMALSGSLKDLRRDPAPKSEKIKVRDPDTFDGSNPRKHWGHWPIKVLNIRRVYWE